MAYSRRNRYNRKGLGYALIGCLSLSLTLMSGCEKEQQQTEPAEDNLRVVMVTKPSEAKSISHSYAGVVQARQKTDLAFRIGGQVIQRNVDVGDQIKVGQVLARLDLKDAQSQTSAVEAQLASAIAESKNAKAQQDRFSQLRRNEPNAVSKAEYDAVEAQYKNALAQVKQARANLDVQKNQIKYNSLVADKSGVITERLIEVGQVVAAGQSAYRIALNGDRDVVIGVPEQSVSNMSIGQPVQVSLWSDPDQRYPAFVREISPAADQSRTFRVKVSLSRQDSAVRLGQSARVYFVEENDAQISVPLSSVSERDGQRFVWVLQPDQTVRFAPVEMADFGTEQVTILNGLSMNDWVVVGGVHLLQERQKVKAVDKNNRTVNLKKSGV